MISFIKGQILRKGTDDRYSWVDVLTDGGVGYRVNIPATIAVGGDQISLFTSFQVREDSQILYGFTDIADRDFFELLITVSGVGPKLGISIMSVYTAPQIKGFILNKNHEALSKVSGLGKKGSQKIVVELENRIKDMGDVQEYNDTSSLASELKEALGALGFSGEGLKQYLKVAEGIIEENPEILLEDLIKLVLKTQ